VSDTTNSRYPFNSVSLPNPTFNKSRTFYNSSLNSSEIHQLLPKNNNSTNKNQINEIISIPNDNRPFLKVKICGSEFIGLLDSGAQITVVGNNVEKDLIKLGLKVFPIDSGDVALANGNKQKATGFMMIPFEYNNIKNTICCMVVPSISRNFVFGCDFWRCFGFEPAINVNFNENHDSTDEIEESPKIESGDEIKVELSLEQKSKLDEVVNKFRATTEDSFGKTDLYEMVIDTGNNSPVQQRQHRFSPYKLELINTEIDRLLKLDIIEECEFSSWCLPVVPVVKPDGSCRLCLDARKLNDITVPDAMPIQNLNRIFESIPKAKYYSKCDLSSAFLQIPLEKESRKKTAFEIANRGFFMYKRTPFGIRNAPSALARILRKAIPSSLEPEIFVFCDDIIVRSNTIERMIELLEILANCLNNAGLTINKDKSIFCVKKLKFLGFIISEKGWEVDEERIKAIVNYPEPKTIKETRRFVGMLGFFRGFIKNMSELTAPITDLTKKPKGNPVKCPKFKFTPEASEAFRKIKEILVKKPILMFPDFTFPFTIHIDASNVAASGILTQVQNGEERVIYYFSKKFSKQEKKYSSVERELLSLLWSVDRFKSSHGISEICGKTV
jgi:hypothetical protein